MSFDFIKATSSFYLVALPALFLRVIKNEEAGRKAEG